MFFSYLQNYIWDIVCSYIIIQYLGKIIFLIFIDFEVGLKVDNECINDYVEVMYKFCMYIYIFFLELLILNNICIV